MLAQSLHLSRGAVAVSGALCAPALCVCCSALLAWSWSSEACLQLVVVLLGELRLFV